MNPPELIDRFNNVPNFKHEFVERLDGVEIRFIGELEKVALAPGDWLVLRCVEKLSEATRERMAAHLQQTFPDHKCLVLDSGARLGVLSPQPANA